MGLTKPIEQNLLCFQDTFMYLKYIIRGVWKMKKNNLLIGIMYIIVGVLFFLVATLTDSKLDSLLFGFAGAGIAPGIMMIYRYFYWNKPGNKERYAERMENEKIEQHDEMKIKLRDKSGR